MKIKPDSLRIIDGELHAEPIAEPIPEPVLVELGPDDVTPETDAIRFSSNPREYYNLANRLERERDELRALTIRTHVVFPDDTGAYPVLRQDGDGAEWVYFTPWMTDGQSSPAFRKFIQALEATPPLTLRLYPGESLLIDNGRILHGRSALGGDKDRLLIRRWIASPFDTFGRTRGREANAVG